MHITIYSSLSSAKEVEELKLRLQMQDVKPNILPMGSQVTSTDYFQKRDQFLKLTFPNGDNRIELVRDNYNAVKYWTRDIWNESHSRQPRSKGRVKGLVPRNYGFLEDDEGNIVNNVMYNNVKAFMRTTFSETKKHMPEVLSTSWSRVDHAFQDAIKNEMGCRFPFFTLCKASWKAHNMLSKWYSHWRGRPGAKKQRRKDSEDDDDDDDEEEEGEEDKENQAGSSATGANTSQLDSIAIPSKHPRQDDSEPLTAAKKAKKARSTVKNPMSLDLLYSFHINNLLTTALVGPRASASRWSHVPHPKPVRYPPSPAHLQPTKLLRLHHVRQSQSPRP